MTETLTGKRVTVLGLGRFGGGVGVARWLAAHGARVTVSDNAPAEELTESVAKLDGCDITFHLGGHTREDFIEADLLVVNPAIPPEMPLLVEAASAGVPQTTEINLFLERCRAPMVGITGSVGKSTTTAMIGEILARRFTTHVGGNIGCSLLDDLDAIAPDHVVVLELSSFQLERTEEVKISPHVAVVTNLTPNHLDRHGTMDAYAAAKKNLFAFQKPGDVLIVNAADKLISTWTGPGKTIAFDPAGDAFELALPGAHNQANAQAAATAAGQFGIDRPTAADALRAFTGLPHRLQFVREIDGVRYYNDSKCTTPGGAIVALEAFDLGKTILIVGGYDKHVSFDALGAVLAARAKAVIAIGATADQIVTAVETHRATTAPAVIRAESFDEAVFAARASAASGDVVLLSPACASYDMFPNYEHRGNRFCELIGP